jgi:choline dehydrogenase-like flavoprotein
MSHHIDVDYAIVGSGAGGSVMAYHLATTGASVAVLERGPWLRARDLDHDEAAMIARLYKDGGAQTNNDANMFVLQGNCVGGSTVLTNAVCFRMPEDVRRSFTAKGFDLPAAELASAFERVEAVLGVQTLDRGLHNPATRPLTRGLRAIGAAAGEFEKALLDCIGCGYCNVGCRYGKKMDAAVTWIPMAERRGALIVPDLEIRGIEHRRGHVTGLRARETTTGRELSVRAEQYVLAAGAINTPELLLRSGIHRGRAGKRTSFHAGAIVFGEFDEPLDGFDGDQMCVHHLTERYVIEQIQNPPVSLALTLPGFYGDHAAAMQRYRHLAALGVLVPTRPSGEVFLGLGHRLLPRLFDHADIRFRLHADELQAFRDGCRTAARALFAAGARRVMIPSAIRPTLEGPDDLVHLDAALASQQDLVGFGSSHPQGGACAGGDARQDVVDANFRVRGFDNLCVVDASVFPHSIRVNPMLSIMATADLAAQRIAGVRPTAQILEGPVFERTRKSAGNARA